jgi:hypothetical protein
VSAQDGMLDIPEPEWTSMPVTDLATVAHRGRIIEIEGVDARFTGTHRGANELGPYVVVHGTDANGHARSATFDLWARIHIRVAK